MPIKEKSWMTLTSFSSSRILAGWQKILLSTISIIISLQLIDFLIVI